MEQKRIRPVASGWILLIIALPAMAQLRDLERTLNLKSLQPVFAHASGNRLLLGVSTNQVSEFLTLIKWEPSPVNRRDSSDRRHKVKIVFGKDLVGSAEVALGSGPAARKIPKMKLVDFVLTFDTEAQAAKAAEILRCPDVLPTPVPRRKEEKRYSPKRKPEATDA